MALILRVLLLAFACCFVVAKPGKVIELDERLNEEKVYKHGGTWVVMFYAPWCGYCQKMKPAWDALATQMGGSNIHVAKVDLTKYPTVGEHHKVEGLPTVKMFHDGEVYNYEGKRDTPSLVEFIRRVTQPPVGNITDLPTLKNIEKSHNVFFVLAFSAGRSSQMKTRYHKAASKLRLSGNFFDTVSKPVMEKLNVATTPSLAVFRDGQSVLYSDKNVSQAALEEWLAAEKFTFCPHLDDHGIYDYIHTKRPLVMALIGKVRSSLEQKLADHVRFIAYGQSFSSDFYFATTDEQKLVRRLLLRFVSKPSLIVWDFEMKTFWQYPKDDYEGVSQQDVENFLTAIKTGEIAPSGGEGFFRRFFRMWWLMAEMVLDVYEASPWVVLACGLVLFGTLVFCVVVMCSEDPEKAEARGAAIAERNQLRRETPGGFYNTEKEEGGSEEDEGDNEEEDEEAKAAREKGKLKQS